MSSSLESLELEDAAGEDFVSCVLDWATTEGLLLDCVVRDGVGLDWAGLDGVACSGGGIGSGRACSGCGARTWTQ
jgi:hypothetical protein